MFSFILPTFQWKCTVRSSICSRDVKMCCFLKSSGHRLVLMEDKVRETPCNSFLLWLCSCFQIFRAELLLFNYRHFLPRPLLRPKILTQNPSSLKMLTLILDCYNSWYLSSLKKHSTSYKRKDIWKVSSLLLQVLECFFYKKPEPQNNSGGKEAC